MRHESRVVIAGGSGFLGQSLARRLIGQGRDVVVLTRRPSRDATPWRQVEWDARTLGPWQAEIDGAHAVVNLVGLSVDCRKTPTQRREILASRVDATLALGRAVGAAERKPAGWVQMSTAHIYGDPVSEVCDENSPIGDGFAPQVGLAWEEAFARACPPGVRSVVLRTTFVLGQHGGALARLTRLARCGLGGRAGHGRQGISWIHQLDMDRLFERAIDGDMRGMYVATAPNPVSNAAFMRALRRAVGMPLGPPAPATLVRIGARLVLRTDPQLALLGRYCVSRRLAEEGFEFRFPEVNAALDNLLRRREPAA